MAIRIFALILLIGATISRTPADQPHSTKVDAQSQNAGVQAAVDQLTIAEREIMRSGLYAIDPEALALWNGRGSLAVAAFGAAGHDDLAARLQKWRATIGAIARDRAEPAIAYLSNPNTALAPSAARDIVFWRSILDTLRDYGAGNTSNSLSRLEAFIMQDVDRSFATCQRMAPGNIGVGDYFSEQQAMIAAQIRRRCRTAANENVQLQFTDMRKAFSERLAGRFPFSANADAPEADPVDVRRFFAAFGDELEPLKRALDVADGPGTEAVAAIDGLIRVRTALSPILEPSSEAPAYEVRVRFFTDSPLAFRQDEIINASFGTDATVAGTPAGQKRFYWTKGQAVTVRFRWAAKAGYFPSQPRTGCMPSNEDSVALFKVTGNWALFRLIRQQYARSANALPEGDVPITFTVPLCANAPLTPGDAKVRDAQIFLRLSLNRLAAAASEAPIAVPNFPSTVPARGPGR